MKKAVFGLFCLLFASFFGCKDSNIDTEVALGLPADTVRRTAADTIGEIARSVQQQSRLYTTACKIHKVVLFSDEAKVGSGPLAFNLPGDRKAAVPIDVVVKGYVDFSQFSEDNVVLRDSLCVITLPDPQVVITSSTIDHKAVRQYIGMTRKRFSEAELSQLAKQGQDSVTQHLTQYGIVERSREACARTLAPILHRMGYRDNNVVIRFRKNFENSELLHIDPS